LKSRPSPCCPPKNSWKNGAGILLRIGSPLEQAPPFPFCPYCQLGENRAAHAALLSLVPAALTWTAILGAWSCCRWRGRRCPAVLQELSKPMLPCGERMGCCWCDAAAHAAGRKCAIGKVECCRCAVWRAAVLRRKRRATTCRLGRRGVCCRCCPSAVQLGEWCMLSLEKLSFTCMCCIVLEGETFPAAPRQVCNSVHGFWRCKHAFPCASIMVHELL